MSQETKSTAPASAPGIWARRVLIALVGGALAFGLLSKPTEMGIFVVACAICLAFENIDKIQPFKGAGFPEVALVEGGLTTTLTEEERQRIDPFVKDYAYYREDGNLRRPESMAKD